MPETPYWLLSKNRLEDAQKSLQWLRGWVKPDVVEKEFIEMQRYKATFNSCNDCKLSHIKCVHTSYTILDKLKTMKSTAAIPMMLILLTAFFICTTGLISIRPYFVQIFRTYGVPLDPNWTSVLMGTMDIISMIFSIVFIPIIGKRKMFLSTMAGTTTCCIVLGLYLKKYKSLLNIFYVSCFRNKWVRNIARLFKFI